MARRRRRAEKRRRINSAAAATSSTSRWSATAASCARKTFWLVGNPGRKNSFADSFSLTPFWQEVHFLPIPRSVPHTFSEENSFPLDVGAPAGKEVTQL